MMQKMKRIITLLLAIGFILIFSACAGNKTAATQSTTTQSEDSLAVAERGFNDAVLDFSNAQSSLHEYIADTEALLETLTEEEVVDPEVLENLRNILEESKSATEISAPSMKSAVEEIEQQIQDILEQASAIWELCDNIEYSIALVNESHQLWIEENQTEIIMVRAELGNSYNYTIYGIDPETSTQRTISEFNIPVSVIANADNSKWQTYPMFLPGWRSSVPLKGMFSSDYMYIAVSRYSQETMECRAGYYREGEGLYYTDVSKSIGAVGGDFDEPVKQMAIGFTDDNQFLFADIPSIPNFFYYDTAEWSFSRVKVSDNGAVIDASSKPFDNADAFLMRGENWGWWPKNCELTDWIDGTHCLINYPEESVELLFGGDRIDRWGVRILDTEEQETTSFIPGESRSNWSGVISPDGQSVAFLSAPASGTGNAALYITSINGGEPVKISEDIPSGRGSTGYILTRPESQKTVYFLLEWRKALR